jgi:hypothetical protein
VFQRLAVLPELLVDKDPIEKRKLNVPPNHQWNDAVTQWGLRLEDGSRDGAKQLVERLTSNEILKNNNAL